jgi:hypothetical protein
MIMDTLAVNLVPEGCLPATGTAPAPDSRALSIVTREAPTTEVKIEMACAAVSLAVQMPSKKTSSAHLA